MYTPIDYLAVCTNCGKSIDVLADDYEECSKCHELVCSTCVRFNIDHEPVCPRCEEAGLWGYEYSAIER